MDTTDFDDPKRVKEYGTYPLIHKHLGKPALLKFIGNVQGLNLLDLGCGNGHITCEFSNAGAKCIGVDPSKIFISEAKLSFPEIDFRVLAGSDLHTIEDACFDMVVLSMVVINISSHKELTGIFQECKRVLKKNGKVILSTLHPMTIRNFQDRFRKVELPPEGHYFKVGMKTKLSILLSDFTFTTFIDSHWPLEEICSLLFDNALVS